MRSDRTVNTTSDPWALIHAERGRLANLLEGLSPEQWRSRSLCAEWSVERVVAHLTAGAHTGTWAWLQSMLLAGFNADRHNARRLTRYLGGIPEETLEMFRNSVPNTVAPSKDYAAWLGEVIVHGQDIARPLGIDLAPDPESVAEVARFFATKDFAVNSRSLVKGLSLEADDAAFRTGSGPMVRGRLLNLVMAMAGRVDSDAELEGAGVAELRSRLG